MDAAAARFERDGHVTVTTLVDLEWVGRAQRHLAAAALPANGVLAVSPVHDEVASALADDPRIRHVADLLLAGPTDLFGFSHVVKRPRSDLVVLWHQDGHPWRQQFGIEQALTIWVALDPATPDSGCLRVIPGSHRLGLQPLRESAAVPNVFGWESDPSLVDEDQAVDVPLDPGDVSVHHPALLHASGPNRTDQRRAAVGLRFCRRQAVDAPHRE